MKKHKAVIGEYTARVMEWNDTFDLHIYKGEELIFRNRTFAYSLKDCATIIRHQLDKKGIRIKWEEDND